MIDLGELRKKAEVATKGPWYADEDVVTGRDGTDYVQGYNITCPSGDVVGMDGILGHHGNNAYFIAAANPSVVLELIKRVEKAEAIANTEGVARDRWELESSVQKSRADEQEDENDRIRDLLARAGDALVDLADAAGFAVGAPADTSASIRKLRIRTARTVAAEIEKEIRNG